MTKQFIILMTTALFIVDTCSAQNPFITHMYTADPSARVFNDTLYVYPSHDNGSSGWKGKHPYRRSICVDYLYYNSDGTIQQVKPTIEGVQKIK
jgi:arabinoxylan arabinofuranohydrolase